MFLILIVGIACFAFAGFQLMRPRLMADRDRRAALGTIRTATGEAPATPATGRESVVLARLPKILAGVHRRLWRRETEGDIEAKLLRAGASRRVSAELFMAGRVGVTGLAMVAGFAVGHGPGRILLPLVFGAAGVIVPGFLLSKAATRRTERISSELPHFVDQLAIAIEAGMSFDSALSYLVEASDGPLTEEMSRMLTELRVGEARRTAVRNFGLRVGSDDAMALANAIVASDQLGSPLAGILRSQAADLRHRRQMYAEERAQKSPVKMLFPMAIFILPVLFVIILGPAFLGSHGLL
jgi:tight adherence protein C